MSCTAEQILQLTQDILDDIPGYAPLPSVAVQNELDQYLAEPLVNLRPHDSVLKWWHDRRSMYPNLSRMALDFLTIPCKWYSMFLANVSSYHSSNFCGCGTHIQQRPTLSISRSQWTLRGINTRFDLFALLEQGRVRRGQGYNDSAQKSSY